VIDVASGKATMSASAGGTVRAVAFAHKGPRAVAVTVEPPEILRSRGLSQVNLYNLAEENCYDGWLKGHKGDVWCAAFSRDDSLLATGGADNGVIVWDIKSRGKTLLAGHTGAVRGVCFSRDGKRLASVSDDDTVRIWDVAAEKELARLAGHRDGLREVHLSDDGRRVVVVSSLGEVAVWELARKAGR
jgi:WD40 repeat protein